MSKIFVEFDNNYADEFDVNGFRIMDRKNWEKHLEKAKKTFEEEETQEVYFGTNEQIIFEGFDDYERSFTVKDITDEEAKVLSKFLGNQYGTFLMVD
jgi:hypothetical protein